MDTWKDAEVSDFAVPLKTQQDETKEPRGEAQQQAGQSLWVPLADRPVHRTRGDTPRASSERQLLEPRAGTTGQTQK